jgi:hypothetical protein
LHWEKKGSECKMTELDDATILQNKRDNRIDKSKTDECVASRFLKEVLRGLTGIYLCAFDNRKSNLIIIILHEHEEMIA